MNYQKILIWNKRITIFSILTIFFVSCINQIEFKSLDNNTPYKIIGRDYRTITDSTYECELIIFIEIDSTKILNTTIVQENDKYNKKAKLYFKNNIIEAKLKYYEGTYYIYYTSFILDSFPNFNIVKDNCQIELIFGDKDSYRNIYKYEKF